MTLGGRGVEERDGVATTYLLPPDDPDAFASTARQQLGAHTGAMDLDVSWRWQPHEDWRELWKRGLDVRRVTDRLVVHPSWLDPEPQPGDLVIRLDPGMAFGTAEHGTTRGCLRLLDSRVRPGDHVLDVGAGSGILSIAAAKLGAVSVRAVELDPLACEAAVENVATNRVSDTVHVEERIATPDWLRGLAPADGIVANLETHLLLPLLEGLHHALKPGGWLVLSGILVHEREVVLRAVDVAGRDGLHLESEDQDGDWWTAAFRRQE